MNTSNVDARDQNDRASKKEYEKPAVMTFGSIAKLTMTKANSGGDGKSGKGIKL